LAKKEKNNKRIVTKELNGSNPKEIRRITVLVDGSETSEKASEIAIQLGKNFDVNVTIIYEVDSSKVMRTFPHPDHVISPQQLELASILKVEAHSFLYELEKICDKIGVNVKTELIENIPYVKIIKNAEPNDLIVVGSNNKLLKRIIRPSIFEKILRHSNSSVMFVR
jgi:nucleotide-binding universal stress UspA family protein